MTTATLLTTRPNKWLIGALLITVTLTLWTFFQTNEPEADLIELADNSSGALVKSPSKSSNQAAPASAEVGMIAWTNLKRTPLKDKIHDPFKIHSWVVVPPVKKVMPQPAPAPVAPPVPFIYLGKYEEDSSNVQFFFQANGKLYSAIKGKSIDQEWRLDGEDVSNLQLTYLPLNLPQVLSKATRTIAPTEPAMAAEMNL